MAKQLQIPFVTHCTYEFFFKMYVCELFYLIGTDGKVKSVAWTLAEFYFNTGLQRPYTSTCICKNVYVDISKLPEIY